MSRASRFKVEHPAGRGRLRPLWTRPAGGLPRSSAISQSRLSASSMSYHGDNTSVGTACRSACSSDRRMTPDVLQGMSAKISGVRRLSPTIE